MANSRKSDSLAWLNDTRLKLLIELIRSTNQCLDKLDSQFGDLRMPMDNRHTSGDVRYWLIANMRQVFDADENARILEVGGRVSLELDSADVLHFWKHDADVEYGAENQLREVAEVYTAKLLEQTVNNRPPVVCTQMALPEFPVESIEIRMPELLPLTRHVAVEYVVRRKRIFALRITAVDGNGAPVTEYVSQIAPELKRTEAKAQPSLDIRRKNSGTEDERDAK